MVEASFVLFDDAKLIRLTPFHKTQRYATRYATFEPWCRKETRTTFGKGANDGEVRKRWFGCFLPPNHISILIIRPNGIIRRLVARQALLIIRGFSTFYTGWNMIQLLDDFSEDDIDFLLCVYIHGEQGIVGKMR